jgi:hypothetical protein
MKRSKNWGVQKAGSAPKAQVHAKVRQKTKVNKKRSNTTENEGAS